MINAMTKTQMFLKKYETSKAWVTKPSGPLKKEINGTKFTENTEKKSVHLVSLLMLN